MFGQLSKSNAGKWAEKRCSPLAHVILTTILVSILSGCSVGKKEDAQTEVNAPQALTGGLGGPEGFRKTVWTFARVNCVGCHGSNQVPKFATVDTTESYNIAMGLVNFTEIPASKFVSKVRDGHCGGACSTDGSVMMRMIQDWKLSYDVVGKPAPTGTVIPTGKIFTNPLPVPSPDPARCKLPVDLQCSPDVTSSTALACANKCWTKLRFPVSKMSPLPSADLGRAWLEADIAYENYAGELGVASYVIKNPRVVSPDVAIYVHDIKIFLNGTYRPEYGEAYRQVDTVVDKALFGDSCVVPHAPAPFDPGSIGGMANSCVPSVQPLFSSSASAAGIVQERDYKVSPDQIAFSFEYFQKGLVGDCKDTALFDEQVYKPIKIGAVACLTCHKSKGDISEAGQRFNMDPDDLSNGATPELRLATVCRRFLQRSNFSLPDNSPIIVQPRQGLNGMPPQDNFNYFAPNWINWIEQEAKLAAQQ